MCGVLKTFRSKERGVQRGENLWFSPLCVLFGYFLHKQKVTQGCGAAKPHMGRGGAAPARQCEALPHSGTRGSPPRIPAGPAPLYRCGLCPLACGASPLYGSGAHAPHLTVRLCPLGRGATPRKARSFAEIRRDLLYYYYPHLAVCRVHVKLVALSAGGAHHLRHTTTEVAR